MKSSRLLSIIPLAALLVAPAASPAAESRVFELRTYYASPGKLDALHTRFRDHTLALFAKHGIESIGYWTPAENKDNKLLFLLAYPSRDAREKSWKAFMDDPAWKKAYADSHKDGPLVARFESLFLQATDYSPVVKASKDDASRLFELRTYVAEAGRLDALHARFRDHTVKLFEKHGMENIGYWVPMKDQPGGDNTLIYFIAHKDKAARDASFAAFGKDPVWQTARKASEEKAGGSLTAKGGVTFVLCQPTDYSKIK